MHTLVVLCGHVGCGKTTLVEKILKQNPALTTLDAFLYMEKYRDAQFRMTPEQKHQAYEDMFADLEKIGGNILLEIGVSRERENFARFGALRGKFTITIVFCLLDQATCIARVSARSIENPRRYMHPDDVAKKFQSPFPALHQQLAKENQLAVLDLDMALPEEILVRSVEALFSSEGR